MKLYEIAGNRQRLDGGAMFGNAPRPMWAKWCPPDDSNRIELACRALLWDTGHGLVLFETGIGAFFDPAMRDRYGVLESEHKLLESLARVGASPRDIDWVVLSHLHFDHAGGLLSHFDDGPPRLVFPKARFLVGREHWERACHPHARDRASFIGVLGPLLEQSGRLVLESGAAIDGLPEGVSFRRSSGHTPGLVVSMLETASGPLAFVADLIPGMPWMHVPITMGYDRFPELLIEEKAALLGELASRSGSVYFTHDSQVAVARVEHDERGRFRGSARNLTELFG